VYDTHLYILAENGLVASRERFVLSVSNN